MTITKPNFWTMSVYWMILSAFMMGLSFPIYVTCVLGAMLGWVCA